jgi:hypothetical protein
VMATLLMYSLGSYLYALGMLTVCLSLVAILLPVRGEVARALATAGWRLGGLLLLFGSQGAVGSIDPLVIYTACSCIVGAIVGSGMLPRKFLERDGELAWERREVFALSVAFGGFTTLGVIQRYHIPRDSWVLYGLAGGFLAWLVAILAFRTAANLAVSKKTSDALRELILKFWK